MSFLFTLKNLFHLPTYAAHSHIFATSWKIVVKYFSPLHSKGHPLSFRVPHNHTNGKSGINCWFSQLKPSNNNFILMTFHEWTMRESGLIYRIRNLWGEKPFHFLLSTPNNSNFITAITTIICTWNAILMGGLRSHQIPIFLDFWCFLTHGIEKLMLGENWLLQV